MSGGLHRFHSEWKVSPHAQRRMAERGFLVEDVDFIINHGQFRRAEKNRSLFVVPDSPFLVLAQDTQFRRNHGRSVIIADDSTVVTVYDNDDRSPYGKEA